MRIWMLTELNQYKVWNTKEKVRNKYISLEYCVKKTKKYNENQNGLYLLELNKYKIWNIKTKLRKKDTSLEN